MTRHQPLTRLDPGKTERVLNPRTGRMEIWRTASMDGQWAYQRAEDTATPWDVQHVPTQTVSLGFTSLTDARRTTAHFTATLTHPARVGAEFLGAHEPDTPEWHALRAGGIGASEIASAVGLSRRWESQFSLWQRKAGRIGPPPENDEMTWGRYLEEPIAQRFADQHPELVITRTGTWRSRDRAWQIANPDRLALVPYFGFGRDDVVVPVECKFVPYSADEFGKSGTEDIPLHHRAQILQQCDVLGAPYGWLVALVGADYREYRIDADPLDIGVLRTRGAAFWASLPSEDDPVGTPPLLDGSDHTYRALKELHPDVDGRDVEIPFSLKLRLQDTQRDAREAAEAHQHARSDLLDVMGTGKRALCLDEHVATRVAYATGTVQLRLAKPPKPTGTITENL